MTGEIHKSILWFEGLYGDSITSRSYVKINKPHAKKNVSRGKSITSRVPRHALGYIHA